MKSTIAIMVIVLLGCIGISLSSEKTIGSVDSVHSHYCKVSKHSSGRNYNVSYTVDGKTYVGTSECTRKAYNNGDPINVYYLKFHKEFTVPYETINIVIASLLIVILYYICSGRYKAKDNIDVRN